MSKENELVKIMYNEYATKLLPSLARRFNIISIIQQDSNLPSRTWLNKVFANICDNTIRQLFDLGMTNIQLNTLLYEGQIYIVISPLELTSSQLSIIKDIVFPTYHSNDSFETSNITHVTIKKDSYKIIKDYIV